MNFGLKLRGILERKKLSQAEAAALLDIRQQSLGYYLTVENPPKYNMLQKMSEVFDVPIDELAGGASAQSVVVRETGPAYGAHPGIALLEELRRRWQKKPGDRAQMELAVRTLWPARADVVLEYLKGEKS